MGTIKGPKGRKAEILEAAGRLFAEKGYEATSVDEIVKAVNLAKGSFYNYFKSKEEALETVAEKIVSGGVERAEKIAASDLSPMQKFIEMLVAQKGQDSVENSIDRTVYNRDNSKIQQKMLILYTSRLSPYIGKVVEECIEAGAFGTPFPKESAQIIISSFMALFNYFHWTDKELETEIAAFVIAMERILGAKPGTLSSLSAAMLEYSKRNVQGGGAEFIVP